MTEDKFNNINKGDYIYIPGYNTRNYVEVVKNNTIY